MSLEFLARHSLGSETNEQLSLRLANADDNKLERSFSTTWDLDSGPRKLSTLDSELESR